MIGFFFCLNGLLSAFASPFSAGASAAGSIAAARAQRTAAERAMRAAMPKTVEAAPHIPRVKRKAAE